jgi:outer membrane protein OmpA-like peptidoglycan-associated protein
LNSTGTGYDTLKLRNQYTISLDRIIADVGLSIYPIPDIPFFTRFGATFGFGLTENTYERSQRIISPDHLGFTTPADKFRIIEKGNVLANNLLGLNGSLGCYFSLTPALSLMPEIGYVHSFSSLLKNEDWKSSSLEFRLGFAYRPLDVIIKTPTPPIYIPEEVPPPPAIASINPIHFAQLEAPDLELQQTVITQTFPILPYIFFDSCSIIPRSIKSQINPDFDEKQVSSNTLETYNNILSIIARRLQQIPDATLVLIGSTDGKEKSNVQLRKYLALDRAKSIKDLLVQNWNIDPNAIMIKARDLPDNLSNKEYIEGDAENRRVEIESSHPNILDPVVYSKFNEYIPLQQLMQLAIQTDTSVAVQSWKIDIQHHGILLKSVEGIGAPPKYLNIPLDSGVISGIGNQVMNQDDSVDITLYSQTTKGESFSTRTTKPIIKTNNTFEISRLSLIVFEYDQSSLSEKNKNMMKNFLNQEIMPESKVSITGSTDKLGEATYNLELSESRAKTVESFMRNIQPNINIISTKGIGASKMLFDNSLPEGRYYCRTVSIEVKNPIQPLPGK